ncbi:MAG: DUF58 domain-containing protein [Thermomicrobiales bacterium]|nr:DUF58 domain-containing protein [Thermomicrobiales bacterium]MCO5219195.1 DUF58 domain-containing protein [Thermomicrobiales bacterium]MCO5225086.1 DUF58 domain-containing protein [Thermomicrobiales bacterium]MCO5228141.1 DUF58 domain-containing protein [Thermomicrobiales bacterium]
MALATRTSGNWYTRLRTWWENPDADVNIRRWAGSGVLIVAVGAFLREPLIAIIGVLILVIGLFLRLWWDNALRNLTYSRTYSHTRAFYGDEVTLTLSALNEKPLPLSRVDVFEQVTPHTKVRDHNLYNSLESRTLTFESVFSLGMYERVAHHYAIDCLHRGWQTFGPTRLVARDPFGVSTRTMRLDHRDGVLVYPRMVPISSFVVSARQPLGDRKPATPLVEDPMRIIGVRPYVPGDSPRRIHWRATARTGDLQTRVFEPSASPVAAIFLDTITFSHLWEGQNSNRLELSIVVVASMARQLIEAKHQVGLYANAPAGSRSRTVRISPGRRGGQLQKILESLAMLQPAFGERIEKMMSRELHHLPWGATAVIVTSQVTPNFQRALLRMARSGGAKRFVILAIGEVPELFPEVRKRFDVYHLSGEEEWDAIQSIQLTRL